MKNTSKNTSFQSRNFHSGSISGTSRKLSETVLLTLEEAGSHAHYEINEESLIQMSVRSDCGTTEVWPFFSATKVSGESPESEREKAEHEVALQIWKSGVLWLRFGAEIAELSFEDPGHQRLAAVDGIPIDRILERYGQGRMTLQDIRSRYSGGLNWDRVLKTPHGVSPFRLFENPHDPDAGPVLFAYDAKNTKVHTGRAVRSEADFHALFRNLLRLYAGMSHTGLENADEDGHPDMDNLVPVLDSEQLPSIFPGEWIRKNFGSAVFADRRAGVYRGWIREVNELAVIQEEHDGTRIYHSPGSLNAAPPAVGTFAEIFYVEGMGHIRIIEPPADHGRDHFSESRQGWLTTAVEQSVPVSQAFA